MDKDWQYNRAYFWLARASYWSAKAEEAAKDGRLDDAAQYAKTANSRASWGLDALRKGGVAS